ncbi:MAG: LacI family DNA-binding transcriptional regulator [Chloroflexi bacterium]|nr:LacI family DNA-binding transcriptional regulator [Chloroflexota bacterium]
MPRQATLKDVAAKAGVRPETVSKVVNRKAHVSPETEARIRQAIRELGYRPNVAARNLRARQSRMIGYSWRPVPAGQFNPILDQFLQSMVEVAGQAGYHLLPFPCPPDHAQVEAYQELVDTNRVDGFILSSTNVDDQRIAYLQKIQFPFIAFGRANTDWDFPHIDVDGTAGLRAATEHLLDRGHRRIAAIAWPEDSLTGTLRLQGYGEAMASASLSLDPAWIARGEHSAAFGHLAAPQLLDLPPERRPTALVALSDLMAIGAMHAIQDRGLEVGRDVAVTGFDDTPMAQYLRPPLTTLRQPVWESGRRAIAMLLQLLRGEPLPEQYVLLKPELIVRESSGE